MSYYKIYRDGTYIAQTTSTSYSDTGLAASTTHSYQVSAVDTSGNEGQLSDTASATALSDGGGGTSDTMYVSAIDIWVSKSYGPFRDISIRVTVVDGDGLALNGVTVYLDLELPDGSIVSYTGTTDSNGEVVFTYTKGGTGTYTATVTNLVLFGYTYDASTNIETSETLIV